MPARHGRAALRGGGRPRQARPSVSHLCAGRLARDAARLSRPPPARERREHLLRQPRRRRERRRSTNSIADPVAVAQRDPAARRAAREDRRCRAISMARRASNSRGLDLSDERRLATLAAGARGERRAARGRAFPPRRRARRPASRCAIPPTGATSSDMRRMRRPDEIAAAIAPPRAAAPAWAARRRRTRARRSCAAPPTPSKAAIDEPDRPHRARGRKVLRQCRRRSARGRRLPALLRRRGGRGRSRARRNAPLGAVVCISPWNFPLAIFTGQVAAALAAGNAVLAKPAEETPLIAAEAVRLLHEAGVPADALASRARRGRGRGGAGRRSPHARRRLHRLDAGRATDRAATRRPPDPRPASPCR